MDSSLNIQSQIQQKPPVKLQIQSQLDKDSPNQPPKKRGRKRENWENYVQEAIKKIDEYKQKL